MGLNLGFALSNKTSQGLCKNLRQLLENKVKSVELSLVLEEYLDPVLDPEVINLTRKFEYRSIHAPVKDRTQKWLSYGNRANIKIIEKLIKLSELIKANTILFHPNQVDDYDLLINSFDRRLAFENMDNGKAYGKTVAEMETVFNKAPESKWVFDVNHAFTVDQSMTLSKEFYRTFKHRLCHYHLSAFGGFHDCFVNTHEDIILSGIQDSDHPMIHEGNAVEKDVLVAESEYIFQKLRKKFGKGLK